MDVSFYDKGIAATADLSVLCQGPLQRHLSVGKPQIRVVNHLMEVVEVLVMVNALAIKLGGRAVQKANQTQIELSYRIDEPASEVAMSVTLWELTYTFDNLPGIQYFDFEFTGEDWQSV